VNAPTSISSFTSYLPLVGVLIGGGIAATSSYLSGLLADRRKQRLESQRLRLQKLEDAFLALRQLEDYSANSFGHAIALTRWSVELPKRQPEVTAAIHRLTILLRVYFPELRPLCIQPVSVRGFFAQGLMEISGEQGPTGQPRVPNPDHTCRALAEAFQPILDTCKQIGDRLERIADETRNT
jgi:hypothetical protein